MSLSNLLIKCVGVVLAVVGLALVLSAVGINFLGVALPFGIFGNLLVGAIFLGAGIIIIRGGTITA